jgi:hypothetical protein
MPYIIEVDQASYGSNPDYVTGFSAKEILQAFGDGRELKLRTNKHFTDTFGSTWGGVKYFYLDRAAVNNTLTAGYFVFITRDLNEEQWWSLHLVIENDEVTIHSEKGNHNHETT